MTANAHKSHPSLPPMDDQEAFSKAVNDRLNELYSQVNKANVQAKDESTQIREELVELRGEVSSSVLGVSDEVQSVWERVQKDLLSAVRLEIVGSVFVVFGLVANVLKSLVTGA